MNEVRSFGETAAAVHAWDKAGRKGSLAEFCKGFRAKVSAEAPKAQCVELWIRRKGTRRFADWRIAGSNSAWSWVEITKADRAEREGRISVGNLIDAPVVMYEEPVTQ